MTVAVRMEPVGGEERLTAHAERLVDASTDLDVHRARGWVGGSGLPALIRLTTAPEHRPQRDRHPRDHREVDESAHERLDAGAVERAHHGAEVPLELTEGCRVDGVVRADRQHHEVRGRVEDGRELARQHVGDAGPARREPRQVHRDAGAGRDPRHERLARVLEARTGERAVADGGDPHRRRIRDVGPVVAGHVEVVVLRQVRVRGAVRLHPHTPDHRRKRQRRPPGPHRATDREPPTAERK